MTDEEKGRELARRLYGHPSDAGETREEVAGLFEEFCTSRGGADDLASGEVDAMLSLLPKPGAGDDWPELIGG